MQTSGNRSIISRPVVDRTARAAGLGLASAFLFLAVGAGSCSPGSLPADFPINAGGGTGAVPGTGGSGGAGGTGGNPGTGGISGGTIDPPAAGCGSLQVTTLADFETKFIAPKCGTGNGQCHAAVFPPRGLDKPDMVSMLLVDRKGSLCATDPYIKKGDPTKSFVWAKISAPDMMVTCPSGGAAGAGGSRMPFGMDPLTQDQKDCFMWYITQRGK